MRNIFLIGYRCTGKTSVGKTLAAAIGWGFIDADAELVKDCGLTINAIVEKHGWPFFREKERVVIKKVCALGMHVVATGGGAVLASENVTFMKKNGVAIWLRATPETIRKRILCDKNTKDLRPALTSKGLIEEIKDVLARRNPYYQTAMDFFVDTDGIGIDEVCGCVLGELTEMGIVKGD